jgi:nicotinamide-nucleotide amidase
MLLEEQVGQRLLASGKTIGTAESCTGGLIASRITDVSGSSAYMLGGVVAYSNAVKQALLNVQELTLIDHGAVSAETAAEMASGAQRLLTVDYALSVTGIAGPDGGTPAKPVGLTFIGLAGPEDLLVVERFVWTFDRTGNKTASVDAAFNLLLQHLPA